MNRSLLIGGCTVAAALVGMGYLAAVLIKKNGVRLDRRFYKEQLRFYTVVFPVFVAVYVYVYWPDIASAGIGIGFFLLGTVASLASTRFFLNVSFLEDALRAGRPPASDLVHNERTKLFAGSLDRASTSCFTVGIATPVAGFLYNVGAVGAGIEPTLLAVVLIVWLTCAVGLHLAARKLLGGLRG